MDEKKTYLFIKISGIAVAAYLTSGIVLNMSGIGRGVNIPSIYTASSLMETRQGTKPLQTYHALWEKNIFNPDAPSAKTTASKKLSSIETETIAEEEIADLPLSSLSYRLIGTVAGKDENSFAIIEDISKKKQVLYHPGDKLGSASITRILRNKVILDNGGMSEMLEVRFDEKGVPDKGRASRSATKGVKRVSANSFMLDRKEVEKISGNISQFMTDVRIVPNMRKGKASGYKLLNIKRGSLIERVGLENGDIIKEINGKNIDKPEEAFLAYSQLKGGAGFTLTIERKGKTETLQYELR